MQLTSLYNDLAYPQNIKQKW